jgi:hypothetical protein
VRTAITIVAFVFTCALAFGTIAALIADGPDVLTALGVLVTALFAIGIFGALSQR